MRSDTAAIASILSGRSRSRRHEPCGILPGLAFNGFSADERAWLASQRLGRLATHGTVGNAPVTYFVRADDTVGIGAMRMGATTKFGNVDEVIKIHPDWVRSFNLPSA